MANNGYSNFNIDDDEEEDVFIQPDVPSKQKPLPKAPTAQPTPPPPPPPPPQQQQQPQASSSSANNGNSEGFFTFSNFINPQNLINPLLERNNIQVNERQFSGGNTLDESVLTTLHRDLSLIGDKLLSILWPLRLRQKLIVVENIRGISNMLNRREHRAPSETTDTPNASDTIQSDVEARAQLNKQDYSKETIKKILDWDLWGPLVFVLGFSLIITYLQTRSLNLAENTTSQEKSSEIFSGSFTLIWAVLSILSINIQLVSPVPQTAVDGSVTSGVIGLSFFQCISILSYTMFPLVIGGFTSVFIKWKLIRLIINAVMYCWSLLCCWLILAIINNCKTEGTPSFHITEEEEGEDDEQNAGDKRIFLMVYPVGLVFGLLSWLCVIV